MEIELINGNLLASLHRQAGENERLRMNYDLRTTPEDTSQRMLNALEPGTKVAIHRHVKTDCGGPVHDGERALDETAFVEVARFRLCPREGKNGIQIPKMAWHTVEVYEPSTIFEAKDGAYEK